MPSNRYTYLFILVSIFQSKTCNNWAATWQNQQWLRPAKTQISPVWSESDVHMKKAWVLSYPLIAERRPWSDWADAPAPHCVHETLWFELPRDKTNSVVVCPTKTQINLGIRPVWSEPSLSPWRKIGSIATHCAHNEDTDQTGRMPRLIWVFTGHTLILLILSWGGSCMQ